jgi:hypothetical protein
MKSLIREHIKNQVRKILEDREYDLRNVSPLAYASITGVSNNNLNIPPSAIVDVKIIKATRPIFRCFFENGHYFDLIDSKGNMEANIDNLLFDLSDDRDLNAAQKEVERLMQKGKFQSDDEAESEEFEEPTEEPSPEEPAEEPEA